MRCNTPCPTLAERQGDLSGLASQMTGPLMNPFTGQAIQLHDSGYADQSAAQTLLQ